MIKTLTWMSLSQNDSSSDALETDSEETFWSTEWESLSNFDIQDCTGR